MGNINCSVRENLMPTQTHETPVYAGELAVDSHQPVDLIDVLIQDHRNIEQLFVEYDHSSTFHNKLKLAKKICEDLTLHTTLEESTLYPTARSAPGINDNLLAKARVEHAAQKWLMSQIKFDTPASPLFDAKMAVLHDYFVHHTHEEETELFPRLAAAATTMVTLAAELIVERTNPKKKVVMH
ncbi:MAG: hemerythrin domain-containing protein [Spongiibacteraceae bacterium]